MKKLLLLLGIFLCVMFFSCEKVKTNEITGIGPIDDVQIFYDLDVEEDKRILLSTKKDDANYQKIVTETGTFKDMTETEKDFIQSLPVTKDEYKNWDLMLTDYTGKYIFRGTTYMYAQKGILINTDAGIEVAVINDDKYDSITLDDTKSISFSKDIDIIGGATWKKTNSNFAIELIPNIYFVIKTTESYYKFRVVNYHTGGTKSLLTIQQSKL